MSLHAYLNFGGDCREAFTCYHQILGGDLQIMGMADVPAEEEVPAELHHLVAHAALRIGDDLLMGSDHPDHEGVRGMAVNLTVDDVDEGRRLFDAFAEGGEVTMPPGPTFWSPLFGLCTDRFGIPWMVNVEIGEAD